jgi:hypothetical protein
MATRRLDAEMTHDGLPFGPVWPNARPVLGEGHDMGDLVRHGFGDENLGVQA